jgi:hypothetical protein
LSVFPGELRPAPNNRILIDSGTELQEQFMKSDEKGRPVADVSPLNALDPEQPL